MLDSEQEEFDLDDHEVEAVLSDGGDGSTATASSSFAARLLQQQPSELTNHNRRNQGAERINDQIHLPLFDLAAKGEIGLIEKFVDEGGDVNQFDEDDQSALMWACANGQLTSAVYLLDHGADLEACSSNGENSLHVASHYGHADIVKMLLSRGLDVNYADKLDCTALMYAAHNNQRASVEILLEYGANITAVNHQNLTAYDIATHHRCNEALSAFNNHMMFLLGGGT